MSYWLSAGAIFVGFGKNIDLLSKLVFFDGVSVIGISRLRRIVRAFMPDLFGWEIALQDGFFHK